MALIDVISPSSDPPVSVDAARALYRLVDRLHHANGMGDVYEAALDAIAETLGCSRASILVFDDNAVMRFVAWRGLSAGYREALEGHTPWKPSDQDPSPIFVEDVLSSNESAFVKERIQAENIRALGFIPLTVDRRVVGKFMTYYEEPRSFPDEEQQIAVTIARHVGFSLARQRYEQARQCAERELLASEERLRIMVETTPAMIWVSDHDGNCVQLNRALREFWGVREEAVAQFDWRSSMHPDDAASIWQKIADAMAQQSKALIRGRYRNASGDYRTLETDARPRISESGEFLGMVGVNTDVTEREQAEAQRELMLNELNHRVKNTITVIQAIANQTFRTSKTIEAARDALQGRLIALASAHDLLTKGSWTQASLKELAAGVLDAEGTNSGRVSICGSDFYLTPKHALTVAMALHELFTNAVKHGALSNDAGTIDLRWDVDRGEERLRMLWTESGGPEVLKPARHGFGSVLLERTIGAVNGTIRNDFRAEGLICEISLDLARLTES